jgi:hypothetical protein
MAVTEITTSIAHNAGSSVRKNTTAPRIAAICPTTATQRRLISHGALRKLVAKDWGIEISMGEKID